MKTIFTIMAVLTVMLAQAQGFICVGDPASKSLKTYKYQSTPNTGKYDLNDLRTWIPRCNGDPLQTPPIMYINISFHVFLDDNGQGSRYADDYASRTKLIALLNNINDTYSGKSVREKGGPSDKVLNEEDELPRYDTRIRFTLGDYNKRIYFYKSTEMNNLCEPLYGTADKKLYNYIANTLSVKEDPSILQDGINIFFIASSCKDCSAYANSPTTSANDDSYIVMFNTCPTSNQYAESAAATVLAHELGHNLELSHTYCGGGSSAVGCTDIKGTHSCKYEHKYDDSEYLSDIFGPCGKSSTFPHIAKWVNPYEYTGSDAKKITNNVMGGTNTQTYISPMQAGQMHRAIAIKSVGKYVRENTHSDVPVVIGNKEKWNNTYVRLFHDIQIKKNGYLTLNANYEFKKNCAIEIEDGGVLSLEKGKSVTMNSSNKIVVKKGGTLIVGGNLDISDAGCIEVQPGGYLCVLLGAKINLNNYLSIIKFYSGAKLGVNTSATNIPGSYYGVISSIKPNGDGCIALFTNNIYIQNQTISKNTYFSGKNIYTGNSITTSKPKGNVVVKTGNDLVLEAENEVLLDAGFEVAHGATLEIK
ncbi:MAG: hypothetical protein J6W13_12750 [Salinivirgaceae bacterium]|nr:hypothetical protein [Salinivirgaceae bacterium]